MEKNTPQKNFLRIELTPSTKQKTCIVCGEVKLLPRDRKKLTTDKQKNDLGFLIEKILDIEITEKSHSDICCRNCERKLTTVDKSMSSFKETYSASRKKLECTHGQRITKRLNLDENNPPTSKKVLFTQDDLEDDMFLDLQQQIVQPDGEYTALINSLKNGTTDEAVAEISNCPDLVMGIHNKLFTKVQLEVQTLCTNSTNSVLNHNDIEKLKGFTFKNVENEWKEHAPYFHRFIQSSSVNPRSERRNTEKTGEGILPAQVSAGCKLLNTFSRNMKSLKNINDIVLLKGGLKKSAFNRMQSTGDCHSYQSAIKMHDDFANQWDTDLKDWQAQVSLDAEMEHQIILQIEYLTDIISLFKDDDDEADLHLLQLEKGELEQSLKRFQTSMHPGYYFVGDNVDMVTKVRTMTKTNQHKDQHMYQMCAYENRVSGNDKNNSKPQQNAQDAKFSQLVPGEKEKQELIQNFSHIVAKKWCHYIPYFGPYNSSLPECIQHSYMKEMKTKTKRINMGVLKKNESKNGDMVDICRFLHKYVPGHDTASNDPPSKVLSGGDYLTFERHKQAQMSVRDDENPSLRMEGLIPKMEEFHNQAEFLRVIWRCLYSTHSSRDIGTMFAARNLINARNVSTDPSGNYYASATMMDKFTDAYIVCGALDYFQMETVHDDPMQNCYTGDIGNTDQMKAYIMQHAEEFVRQYVDIDIQPLPDFGPQSNNLQCRYCDKALRGPKKLQKHELLHHGHPVNDTEENRNTRVQGTADKILQYTKLTLTLGLLRQNHNDAISLGDGHRIMLVNSYLYLLYKQNNCPKYAFGILETLCQVKILLSERMAHRLMLNRVVNYRGKANTNHPNDLDLEHCNKIFKDEAHSFRGVFTEKTISRVSRSALASHEIMRNFDKQTDTVRASGKHVQTDITEDVEMIVAQLKKQMVFKDGGARQHESFSNVESNPFIKLNMTYVRDWISESLKKYSKKHFY